MKQQIRFSTSPDGVRIAYATTGTGPPLVKAANWLSHLEFDWESPVWHHWLTELSKHHTFVRYDKRGCGLSDWNAEDFSLRAQVQDLEAVVHAAGLDRFPLLGISGGGPIALTYAALHPEKVSHLILYGGYVRGRLQRATSPRAHKEAEILLKSMEVGWGQDNPAFRQIYTSLFIPEGTNEQIAWFNELQRISTAPEIAVRMAETAYALDVSDVAPEIAVPTLVLHARNDAVVSFEQGRLLAGLIPDARFVPLDSKNHVLLNDEPAWTRFLAEVRSFIRTPATESERAEPGQAFPELTPREREVLELIAQGLSNDQVADRLIISPKTARNHVSRIYSKLQVNNRPQAIVLAREAGLSEHEPSQ